MVRCERQSLPARPASVAAADRAKRLVLLNSRQHVVLRRPQDCKVPQLLCLHWNMDEARWERIERTIEYLTIQQAAPETHEALKRARHRTATVLQRIDQLVQAQRPTDEPLNALMGVVDFHLNLTPPRAV